jgi:hypothetical protein
MSEEHSNIQKYVIVVGDPKGRVWVVGTETQRGFTEAGAEKALERVDGHLPYGWNAHIAELSPVTDVLALEL